MQVYKWNLNTNVIQMTRLPSVLTKQKNIIVGVIIVLFILNLFQWYSRKTVIETKTSVLITSPTSTTIPTSTIISTSITTSTQRTFAYRRQSCSCTRPLLNSDSNLLTLDELSSSLCSHYSTLRGPHQRIIAISMYGPKENSLFALNTSLNFLHALVLDMEKMYPNWILRIYHDVSIKEDIICPIECAHNYVDFCNASALGNLGNLASYVPPKIWRFLPAGDELVDIMGSRDLDSPIIQRELDAVNEWISSGKAWHSMRDHPWHVVPMLGGMWGFRPALNRTFSSNVLKKILDRAVVVQFGGRGDQRFLSDIIWPHIQNYVIAHDSFLCRESYGKNSQPWPTRRPPLTNDTNCFVGCVRPCCNAGKHPFGECPMECRPKNHTDWTFC